MADGALHRERQNGQIIECGSYKNANNPCSQIWIGDFFLIFKMWDDVGTRLENLWASPELAKCVLRGQCDICQVLCGYRCSRAGFVIWTWRYLGIMTCFLWFYGLQVNLMFVAGRHRGCLLRPSCGSRIRSWTCGWGIIMNNYVIWASQLSIMVNSRWSRLPQNIHLP